jgi:type VI protein secretion system component VasK
VIRWLRLLAIATAVIAMIGLGVIVGLFLVANAGWVVVDVPPWLRGLFAERQYEIWLPTLIAGWLATSVLLALTVLLSMAYVWRRRQYEALVDRLERELARLRNLPLTDPSPLEDMPEAASERPDPATARALATYDDAADDELGPWARD